ncbi:MAG: bifunctional (p)ppGpp synthetase/guanosine-3',5'-bis(diphosphate) 3'-pyrophosphohydrolase [Clostridia bacterium]|nr:bifunctional (p)ppGpp synthetase/guanosine-3',5'-bis(diphosphate) 3'-pyrophosphohydrolase [Clostridia bacterium]
MSKFEKAVDFAVKAHSGQKRKDGGIYVLHPFEVAAIAASMTQDEDVICAALLHDTVEDTPVTAQDIIDNFGPDIALLVEHETENKRPELPPAESWKIRKVESLEVLRTAGTKTKILWVADKLSNMRALAADFEKRGVAAFEKFNVTDISEQKWYHQTVLEYTAELKEYPAYREYERLFRLVFGNN